MTKEICELLYGGGLEAINSDREVYPSSANM